MRGGRTRVRLAVRPSDFIARLGGEEFALLIPGATPADLRDVAERVRHLIGEAPMATLAAPITITASFGFAVTMPDEGDITGALNRTDDALYRAKRAGRNQVMDDAVESRFASPRDTA